MPFYVCDKLLNFHLITAVLSKEPSHSTFFPNLSYCILEMSSDLTQKKKQNK